MPYCKKTIDQKWQAFWATHRSFETNLHDFTKPKYYILSMFPYPSGAGLHMGHMRSYTITDVMARFKRMQGFNVLNPMGWDAFGLPAEHFSIKTNRHPSIFTNENIAHFKQQLHMLGFSFDWSKEINTTDPQYYRWTQWIFRELYVHGLATLQNVNVNWCDPLKTILSNEEIVIKEGHMFSEHGSFPVIKKHMQQWVLKITNYAASLLNDLPTLNWGSDIKDMQRHWIGQAHGTIIDFALTTHQLKLAIFTTRADTIFGVASVNVSPEHWLFKDLTLFDEPYRTLIQKYLLITSTQTDLQREQLNQRKNGVFTGLYAHHPITKQPVPIFIANYVLGDFGTGAVMCVPAHHDDDFAFAQQYQLPITYVLQTDDHHQAFLGESVYINAGFLNGMTSIDTAQQMVTDYLSKHHLGKAHINYRLRDWIFSRQRYWGEPIPVLFDQHGTPTIVAKHHLPVVLPDLVDFKPDVNNVIPLAKATAWKTLVIDDQIWQREVNTMPQWAGSSWYHIAYLMKHGDQYREIDDPQMKAIFKHWLPVDLYIGGKEHAVLHLIYARFWHKFLYQIGIVDCPEPFQTLFNQGMILDADGEKMSKSKANVISPDQMVDTYGADTVRLYILFMGPVEKNLIWSNQGLVGAEKWLHRVYRLFTDYQSWIVPEADDWSMQQMFHTTLKAVSEDYEVLKFNTVIAKLMILVNHWYKYQKITHEHTQQFLIMLNPICPHLSEELWSMMFNINNDPHHTITSQSWPLYNQKAIIYDKVKVLIQINNKVKLILTVMIDLTSPELLQLVRNNEQVSKMLQDKQVVKEIVVINKLVNFIIAPS